MEVHSEREREKGAKRKIVIRREKINIKSKSSSLSVKTFFPDGHYERIFIRENFLIVPFKG